jgi:hypothetical protein
MFSKVSVLFENIRSGAIYNYIEMAYIAKTSFMIMNPNKLTDNKVVSKIAEFSDHYSHCEYIWKEYITTADKITSINIIAHKNASFSVIKLVKNFPNDFKNKINNIFLINSQHNSFYQILNSEENILFQKVIIKLFRKQSTIFSQMNK